jgi:cytochrome d ubiquinol oxidase subunit II
MVAAMQPMKLASLEDQFQIERARRFASVGFLILLGIVLRVRRISSEPISQEAFTYSSIRGKVFSVSSSLTPLFLGIIIGAISSDTVVIKDSISLNGYLRT